MSFVDAPLTEHEFRRKVCYRYNCCDGRSATIRDVAENSVPVIDFVGYIFVAAGTIVLGAALFPISRLVAINLAPRTRQGWSLLRGMVWLFIAGYLSYAVAGLLGISQPTVIVSCIFFVSSWPVLLVSLLSGQTVEEIQRLSGLEGENLTDPLTGLLNRRHLDNQLKQEVNRCIRYGLPISVLMIDVDHFKSINENYGRDIGDCALKSLASVMRDSARETDIAARYDGEELAMVLPNTARAGAMEMAQRLRERIANHPLHADASLEPLKCTVSIGVAEYSGGTDDPNALIPRADQALGEAKRRGRNCVVMSGEYSA